MIAQNPAELKPAADSSTATDPLLRAYGGWTAVENSGIALAESANLVTIPGRKCGTGLAGMKAYEAAKSKNQDTIVEAADVVATACAKCHDKYRDVPGGEPDRCK